MGTRGAYGLRKNGEDKLTYNHFDSYPDYLGRKVIKFCKNNNVLKLHDIFNRIILIDKDSTPTNEQINECIENGFTDFSVSSQSKTDWYCLLRNCQGNLDCWSNAKDHIYMINDNNFIKDSLWCEYAYIINLDDEVLEFYEGFQKQPQPENRYGTESRSGYYPCKLSKVFPLNEIDDVEEIIKMMQHNGEDNEDDEDVDWLEAF